MGKRLIPILLLTLAAGAQGAHITDELLAGLYEAPDGSGEPAGLLISGTPVEVLSRRGGFTQVRLGDDRTGWVESRYVTQDKPAKVKLLELQAKAGELQRKLDLAQRRLKDLETEEDAADPDLTTVEPSTAPPPPTDGDTAVRLAGLEQRLAALQQRSVELEAENSRLRQRIHEAAALLTGSQAQPVAARPAGYRLQAWHISMFAFGLLVSFVGGIVFKNYRISRQYGSYRI